MADKAEDKKRSPSVKSILGGDILANDFFRRQTKLLILMMIFILFYIHNRYASQQQQIEIDKLKKELIDIKYDALTRSSELMEKSRQSRIEEYVSEEQSDLQTSTNPQLLPPDCTYDIKRIPRRLRNTSSKRGGRRAYYKRIPNS